MSVSGHIDEEIFGKAYDSRLVRRLLRYVWPYRLSVAVDERKIEPILPLQAARRGKLNLGVVDPYNTGSPP